MKKLSFTVSLLLATIFVYAQNKELNNAYNAYANRYYDKAKDAIEKAILNEETAKDAKTWAYRGNIYLQIANIRLQDARWQRAKEDSLKRGKPAPTLTRDQQNERTYLNLCTNCAEIAYESYMKALELDPKITIGMNPSDPRDGLKYCSGMLYDEAIDIFEIATKMNEKTEKEKQEKKFEEAHVLLVKAHRADPTKDYVTFLLAYTAEKIDKMDVAKANYNGLIRRKDPTRNMKVYLQLANIYKSEKDTVRMLKILQDAEAIFLAEKPKEDPKDIKPKDTKKTTEENKEPKETMADTLYREFALSYSFFLSWAGKIDDAADIIDKALEKYPDNYLLLVTYGATLSEDKQYAKAEKYLKMALDMQPNEEIILYNLGNCYYNNYVDLENEINKIKNDNEYAKALADAKKTLAQARPYLEKAHEMNSKDKNTIIMLRIVYMKMELMDEFNAMDEKLNALGK
jgi:tetratricopeptide (TPR) repeat protein